MRPPPGVLAAIVALITTVIATRFILPWLRRAQIIDMPRHHSSHTVGTPRGGGLGILVGLLAGLAVSGWIDGTAARLAVLAGMTLVGVMGWLDDLGIRLPLALRLAAQFAAAFLVVEVLGGVERWPFPSPLDGPFLVLGGAFAVIWIVAVTNFYNFMDGLDGLAGGQALVTGLVLSSLSTGGALLEPGLALTAACLGFLVYNWHPSRLFMGDVGSQVIGFLIGSLPFLAPPRRRGEVIFIVALSLWFCLADGTLTLLRRIARGERFWEGHRQHLYQRLQQTGLRHDQVALGIGIAALPASLVGVLGFRRERPAWEWAALAAGVVAFAAYLAWTLAREHGGRTRIAS